MSYKIMNGGAAVSKYCALLIVFLAALTFTACGCGYEGDTSPAAPENKTAVKYLSVTGTIGEELSFINGSLSPAPGFIHEASPAGSFRALELRARDIDGNIIYGCSYRFIDDKTYILNIPVSESSPLILIEACNASNGATAYQRIPGTLPKASDISGQSAEAANIDLNPKYSAMAAIALECRVRFTPTPVIGAAEPGGMTSFEVELTKAVKDYYSLIGGLSSASGAFARAALLLGGGDSFPGGLDTSEMTVTVLLKNAAALSGMYSSGLVPAGLLLDDPAVTIYDTLISGGSAPADIEKIVSRMVSSIDMKSISVPGETANLDHSAEVTAEIGTFAPPARAWTELKNAAEFGGVYGHALVNFRGSFYLIGGAGASGPRNSVWRSSDCVSWERATESVSFAPRYAHGCAVFGDKIWVIGGHDDKRLFNDIWSSSDGVSWTLESAAAPFGGRYAHSLVAGGGRLWMLGGYSETGHKNDIWYSNNGSQWVEVNNGSVSSFTPRSYFSCSWFAGSLWVLGGASAAGILNDAWSSADGIYWKRLPRPPFTARRRAVSFVMDGLIWVAGGDGADAKTCSDSWCAVDGSAWARAALPERLAARCFAAAAVSDDGAVWIAGGLDQAGRLSDMWSSSPSASPAVRTPLGLTLSKTSAATFSGHDYDLSGIKAFVSYEGGATGEASVIWTAERGKITATYYRPVSAGAEYLSASCVINGAAVSAKLEMTTSAPPFSIMWSKVLTPMPFAARTGYSLVEFSGKLWMIGGIDASSSYRYDIWNSPDGVSWTLATSEGPQCDRNGAFVFNGALWVITPYGSVWRSFDGVEWSAVSAKAAFGSRKYFASAVHGGKIWIIGGLAGYSYKNDVWCSSDGVSWDNLTPAAAFTGRSGHEALSYDGKLWVIGGESSYANAYYSDYARDVWYSEDGANWSPATLKAGFSGRGYFSAAVYKDFMVLTGGSLNGTAIDSAVWYSRDGEKWFEAASSAGPAPLSRHDCAVFMDGLWTAGGYGFESVYSSSPAPARRLSSIDITLPGYPVIASGQVPVADFKFSAVYSDQTTSEVVPKISAVRGKIEGASYYAPQTYGQDSIKAEYGEWGALVKSTAAFDVTAKDTRNENVWVNEDQDAIGFRYMHASEVFNGRIWVSGGFDGFGVLGDILSSPDGAVWTKTTTEAAFGRRYTHGMKALGGKLWVVGGIGSDFKYKSDVWSSADGVNWVKETASVPFSARNCQNMIVFKDKLWLISGSYFNESWSSADGVNWVKVSSSLPFGGRHLFSCCAYGGYIWLSGGKDESGKIYGDMWRSPDGVNWEKTADQAVFGRRFGHGLFAAKNSMWLVSGDVEQSDGTIDYAKDVWRSSDGVNWVISDARNEFRERYVPSAVEFNGRLMLIGGWNKMNIGDIWSMSTGGGSAGSKNLVSLSLDKDRDTIEINSIYDLRKIHAIAVYDDGSTAEVRDIAYSGKYGKIYGYKYYSPHYSLEEAVDFSYIEAGKTVASAFNIAVTLPYDKSGLSFYQKKAIIPSFGLSFHESAVFNSKIWLTGGFLSTETYSTSVWNSTDGVSWTKAAEDAGFGQRLNFSLTVFKNKLWVIGGSDGKKGFYNDIWCSDDGVNWVKAAAAAPFEPRKSHCVKVFRDRLWLIGGGNSYGNFSDIWSSADGIEWKLEVENAAFGGRIEHKCEVFNDKLYISCGYNAKYLNDVWSSADGVSWERAVDYGPFFPRGRHGFIVWRDHLWIIGGNNASTPLNNDSFNDMWRSSDGINWTQITNSGLTSRNSFSCLVYFDDLLIFGGVTEGNKNQRNDLWTGGAFKPEQVTLCSLSLYPQSIAAVPSSAVDLSKVKAVAEYSDGSTKEAAVLWRAEYGRISGNIYTVPEIPGAFEVKASYTEMSRSVENIITVNSAKTIEIPGSYWTAVSAAAGFGPRAGHSTTAFNGALWTIGGISNENFKNDIWRSADGEDWSEVTTGPLFSTRSLHSAIVFQNKLWVIGGYDQSGVKNDVWCSDDGSVWKLVTGAAEFSPRRGHKCVAHNGSIWLTGGEDGTVLFNDVWNSADGISWRRISSAAPFIARAYHNAVSFAGKIWVSGGSEADIRDLWRSSDGENWELVNGSTPFIQTGISLEVMDAKLWAFGGKNNNGVFCSADGIEWFQASPATNLEKGMIRRASAVFANKLWLTGGYGSDGDLSSKVWSSSPASVQPDSFGRKWVKISSDSLPGKRHNQAAAVFNGYMWVCGGYDDSFVFYPDMWRSADGFTWQKTHSNFLSQAGHTMLSFKGNLWTIAGAGASDFFANVWRSADGFTWVHQEEFAAFGGRAWHGSVVFDGKMWVIGGCNRENNKYNYKNDIWCSSDGSSWSQVNASSGFEPRAAFSICVHDSKIWIIGGINNNGAYGDSCKGDIWCSSDGVNWRQVLQTAPFGLRAYASLVSHGGKMWLAGGQDNSFVKNDVWCSSDGVNWELATGGLNQDQYGRASHSAVIFNNKMFLMFGRNSLNSKTFSDYRNILYSR